MVETLFPLMEDPLGGLEFTSSKCRDCALPGTYCLPKGEAVAMIGFLWLCLLLVWRCSDSLRTQTSMIRQLAITACVASDHPLDSGMSN